MFVVRSKPNHCANSPTVDVYKKFSLCSSSPNLTRTVAAESVAIAEPDVNQPRLLIRVGLVQKIRCTIAHVRDVACDQIVRHQRRANITGKRERTNVQPNTRKREDIPKSLSYKRKMTPNAGTHLEEQHVVSGVTPNE